VSTSGQHTIIQGSRSSELRIGILCVNVDPASREGLEVLVSQTPGAHVVDNVDRLVTPREVLRILDQFQHRVCVIDFDDGEESSRIAHKLRTGCGTAVNLFAASSDSNPEQIITAMRAPFTTAPCSARAWSKWPPSLPKPRPGCKQNRRAWRRKRSLATGRNGRFKIPLRIANNPSSYFAAQWAKMAKTPHPADCP